MTQKYIQLGEYGQLAEIQINLPQSWNFEPIVSSVLGDEYRYTWPEDLKRLWSYHTDRCPGSLYGFLAGKLVEKLVEKNEIVREYLGVKNVEEMKEKEHFRIFAISGGGKCIADGVKHVLKTEPAFIQKSEGREVIIQSLKTGWELKIKVRENVLKIVADSGFYEVQKRWKNAGSPRGEDDKLWKEFQRAGEDCCSTLITLPPSQFFRASLNPPI